MRKELEQMEQIERYLSGQLSAAERLAFEQRIANDPELQEEVRLQQEVMNGIERAALKQQTQQAAKRFHRGRGFTRWGLSGLCAVIILAAILYAAGKIGTHSSGPATMQQAEQAQTLPGHNEQGGTDWADADRRLRPQTFVLNAASDTVIETKGGMVLAIPANDFLDDKGQPVKGSVQLIIKEALDAASIIEAGLSSQSGARLLESGGMFYVDARQDGKSLRIDPSNGIYTQVPADTIKTGMQLFSGKRMPDGSIDWINPRPLEHGLVSMDIHLLDFYPPHYLDSLASWHYPAQDKRFTDSLYYSFAAFFQQIAPVSRDTLIEGYPNMATSPASDSTPAVKTHFPHRKRDVAPCGIDPARIKTIWNSDFQNTLLSTRQFEQRIPWIHQSANNHILDLYVNHLDMNLSDIDSMAARQLSGSLKRRFLAFAARHDGKVQNGNKQFDQLRTYYERKATAFREAIAKTQHDFWNKQAELDQQAQNRKFDHQNDSAQRVVQLIGEEFNLNLKEAYRQLGYDTTLRPINRQAYTARITNTGWCNVDRYVIESVVSRTTLNYTDSSTGKKAIINYLPVSFDIDEAKGFDRLYVYLLPDKLSSFMRVAGADGIYTEKLNELMTYKLVCIAYKDEQAFFYSRERIQPGNYQHIQLTKIGKEALEQELNKTGTQTQAAALSKENAFFLFDIGDQQRQKNNQALSDLRAKIWRMIIPCYLGEAEGSGIVNGY